MDYTNSQIHPAIVEQLHQAHNLLVIIAREITVSGHSEHVQTQAAERLVTTLEKVYGSVGQYMCYQCAGEDEFKVPVSNKPLRDHDEDGKVEEEVVDQNGGPLARSLQTPHLRLSLRLIEHNLRGPMSSASTPSPISACSRSMAPTLLIRRKPVRVRNRTISHTSRTNSWETLINSGDGDHDIDTLVQPLNIKKRQLPDLKIQIPELKGNPVVCVITTGVPREDSPVLGTSFSLRLGQ